ncbi:MAG: glycosyltransferase [Acidiferrobacter sp.]
MARRETLVEVIYAPLVGGSEMLAFNLCKEWQRTGIKTRICCLYERQGELTKVFEEAGIAYDLLDIGGHRLWGRWARAARYFWRVRPAAIHVHHLGSLINVLLPAYATGCFNVVYTEHSAYWIERTRWMRWVLPIVSRMVRRFTCVSQNLSEFAQGLGVPRGRVMTIYNGVDTERYHPNSVRPDAVPVLRIGAVGRLVLEKDYPTLLAALAILKEKHIRFFAEIAGDGPLGSELRIRAKALDLHRVLQFRGRCDNIPGFLRELDIYVLSSQHEGFPIAVLEAMATALPVVATRITAIPEVIEDGKTGILVDPGDAEGMAAVLLALAHDPRRRRQLGEAAMKKVRSTYTIKQASRSYAAELGIKEKRRVTV